MDNRLGGWLLSFVSMLALLATAALFYGLIPFPCWLLARCDAKLLIVNLAFDPNPYFQPSSIPKNELADSLKAFRGNSFQDTVSYDFKTSQQLKYVADEVLPDNLPDIEAELLRDGKVQSANLTIYGWNRDRRTWLAFLPRDIFMRNGLQHYNPQGRVVGLPNDLRNDDRGSLIAAFVMAQLALANKSRLSAEENKQLVAAKERVKTVLGDSKYKDDRELQRAYGTILMAIEDQNPHDPGSAIGRDDAGLPDLLAVYNDLLIACNDEPRCADDRRAQILNDRGNLFVLLGDIEGVKTRPGETSRYLDAIEDYKEARLLWNHGQPADNTAGALATNNLGLAEYRLAGLLLEGTPVRAEMRNRDAIQHFQAALQAWQRTVDPTRHQCAWSMTQRNLSLACQGQCAKDARTAAETASKDGNCPQ